MVRLRVDEQTVSRRGGDTCQTARHAQRRDRNPCALRHVEAGFDLSGLRAEPSRSTHPQVEALRLQSERLRVPQRRHRSGDVHRETRPTERHRRRRPHRVREPHGRKRVRRGEHSQHPREPDRKQTHGERAQHRIQRHLRAIEGQPMGGARRVSGSEDDPHRARETPPSQGQPSGRGRREKGRRGSRDGGTAAGQAAGHRRQSDVEPRASPVRISPVAVEDETAHVQTGAGEELR